jgi:putative ABC transport system permease protein
MKVQIMVRGTKTAAYTIYGDYPELIKQESMDTKGRFVNQQDIVKNAK